MKPEPSKRLYPARSEIQAGLDDGKLLLGWQKRTPPSRQIGFSLAPEPSPRGNQRIKVSAVWSDDMESHSLCIAKTGSGKGRSSLIPRLLTWKGSAVVVDPKGEAAAVTARYRREVLGQKVVYVDPFGVVSGRPDGLNPLDAMPFFGESVEEFALSAPGLLHPDHVGSAKESFWDNNGDNLISAVICYLLACEPAGKRTFARLRELLMAEDVVYGLAVLMDTTGKHMPEMARTGIANFLGMVEVTRSGVLATAQQHLRLLAAPNVVRSLSRTTFDLEAFQRGEPMTIYLILPVTRLQSHGMLLRSWLSTLFSVAMSREHLPETTTYFLVDEVAAIGHLNQLSMAFTLLRGYGVKVGIYLQDLQQLKRLYPLDWETMVNNAGTIQIFQPSTHLMAEPMAGLFGKEVQADDILRLPRDEQLLLFQGGRWERCLRLDYLADACFKGRYDKNPRYGR